MDSSNEGNLNFYDLHPKPADFFAEVIDGLNKTQKSIPPKFFYDKAGSRLFDAICDLPEYYPTRTEINILKQNSDEIADHVGAGCLLVEPGSGSSHKVRLLLDGLRPHAYIPMEISREHLRQSAEDLGGDYPWLDVHATCADFTSTIRLPYSPEGIRKVVFFPGSTIGNFEPEEATRFLQELAGLVGPNGGLLIGVDLKKSKDMLHAAYDDEQGVTAAFNVNLLKRINRELGADFKTENFCHQSFYNELLGRVELHLVSQCDHTVSISGECFSFTAGESIHTENSYKYTIEEFQDLANKAGFRPQAVWMDDDSLFSVHYFILP